jgi:hypothetical protein
LTHHPAWSIEKIERQNFKNIMTRTHIGSLLIASALLVSGTWAFVAKSPCSFVRQSNSQLKLVEGSFLSEANNLLISTIDSDIANIPNDQFGLVFAGGIVSVPGGLLFGMHNRNDAVSHSPLSFHPLLSRLLWLEV